MPVDRLVHAAQPKIAHCAMNIGYKIRNGGLGNVSAIVTAHPILIAHAEISNRNLIGHV